MRLNTYAHVGDKKSAHLIAVRSGTTLHIDPAYTRYTHQLILRNDGYYLHGIDETLPGIPYGPGTMFCCDTHSPHKLSRDPRLTAGMFYVALAVDSDRAMTPDEAWAALGPVL